MRRLSPALLICLFLCFAVVFLTVPLAASPCWVWEPQPCLDPYCPGAPLYPGSTFNITFDEVGAEIVPGGINGPYPYEYKVVPLPFPVMPGIVEVYEFQYPGEPSDLLIFGLDQRYPSSVTIISDVADLPLPYYGFTPYHVIEQGTEGYNGVVYLAGYPGYPGVNSYEFFSDVPEPGTLMLLGSGLIGVAGFIRRRRRA